MVHNLSKGPFQTIRSEIGVYAIEAPLGSGDFGDVFLVRQEGTGARLALKILSHEISPEAIDRFRNEFKTLTELRHGNLCSVYDFGQESGGRYFFTSDYIEGKDIFTGTRGKGWELVEQLLVQILSALDYIHSTNVIHWDLKPENILVTETKDGPVVKLVDFGLATHRWREEATQTRGTLLYMAPEILLRRPDLDHRIDLYSLGIILYRLLYGIVPSPPLEPLEVIEWHLKGELRFPPSSASIPEYLKTIISRLLEKNPRDRFSEARTVLKYLTVVTSGRYRTSERQGAVHLPSEGPLVGRKEELARLCRFAGGDEGSICWLLGERGLGKSRLLKELHYHMELKGIPFVRIDADRGGDLVNLPPSKPSIILIDGVHQLNPADRSRLETLMGRLFLASVLGESPPFRIVLTSLPENQAVPWLRQLIHLYPGVTMTLHPLTMTDIRQLAEEVLGDEAIPSEQIEALERFSGGNPSLVWEALRQISAQPEAATRLASLSAQTQLSELFSRTMQILSGEEKKILQSVALCEERVSPLLLTRATGLTHPEIQKNVRALAAHGLVDVIGPDQNIRTSSEALARFIQGILTPDEIKSGHANLAQAYKELSFAGRPEFARHCKLAGLKEKAFAAYRQAALGAKEKQQTAQAIPLFEAALPLADTDDDRRNITRSLVPLLVLAGRAHEAVSLQQQCLQTTADFKTLGWIQIRLGQYDDALRTLNEGLTFRNETGDSFEVLSIRSEMANVCLQSGRPKEAVALFREIRDQSGRVSLASRASLFVGDNLHLALSALGDHEGAEAAIDEKSRLLGTNADSHLTAALQADRGYIQIRAGNHLKAVETLDQALKVSESIGDLHNVPVILSNLVSTCQRIGRYADALRYLDKQIRYGNRLGAPDQTAHQLLTQSSLYTILSLAEPAARSLDLAEKIFKSRHNERGLLWVTLIHGYQLKEKGRMKEALNAFHTVVSDATQAELNDLKAWGSYAAADLSLETGDLKQARELVSGIRDDRSPPADPEFHLRIRLLKFKLEGAVPKGADQRPELKQLVDDCKRANLLELTWEAQEAQADHAYRLGKTDEAGKIIGEAATLIRSIASGLPEEYHRGYLEGRARHQVLKKLEDWSRPIPRGPSPQMRRLFPEIVRHKKKETAMAPKQIPIDVLIETNRRLTLEHDTNRLLEMIMDYAISLSGAERGLILTVDDGGGIQPRVARNLRREEPADAEFSNSLAAKVIRTGRPLISMNAGKDINLAAYQSVVDLGLKSVACLPLQARGKTLGVIYLDNNVRDNVFSESDTELLAAFADQAAIALMNAELFQEKERYRARLEAELEKTKTTLQSQSTRLEELEGMVTEVQGARETRYRYDHIIGQSRPMMEVLKLMDKITNVAAPVFIFGETGTGKELLAKALHYNSARKDKKFVAINCSALPETILESELFGYNRGAFTGADRDKPGLFEEANGGTLFLDEIGDMSPAMQAKILRVIQEQEVMRLGGKAPQKIDVRIVSASNRDIREMVRAGKFREDLFYRIGGLALKIPPLRDRREDIPLLVDHFIKKSKETNKLKGRFRLSREVTTEVMAYGWPGNIRELEQVITNATILADDGTIRPEHLLLNKEIHLGKTGAPGGPSADDSIAIVPEKKLTDYEREIVEKTLSLFRGNKRQAADHLGITRVTLRKKLGSETLPEGEEA